MWLQQDTCQTPNKEDRENNSNDNGNKIKRNKPVIGIKMNKLNDCNNNEIKKLMGGIHKSVIMMYLLFNIRELPLMNHKYVR